MIFFFSLLYVYSCIEKNNNYDSNGLKNDYWIEKDSFLDTFSEGFYNKGNKTGIWIYKKNNIVFRETEFLDEDSIKIEKSIYKENGVLYLKTQAIQNQLINIDIVDTILYKKLNPLQTSNVKIGAQLFAFHCGACHQFKPFIESEIDLNKFKDARDLNSLLEKHRNRDDLDKLSIQEIELIREYIE